MKILVKTVMRSKALNTGGKNTSYITINQKITRDVYISIDRNYGRAASILRIPEEFPLFRGDVIAELSGDILQSSDPAIHDNGDPAVGLGPY